MQPLGSRPRQTAMPAVRRRSAALAALIFAVLANALPTAEVVACSCLGGAIAQQVPAASVAFVGTVVDRREGARFNEVEGRLLEYEFHVERATAPMPETAFVHVSRSEASCGVTFSPGERWLVVVPRREDLGDTAADTHLCAGNTPMEQLQPHEVGAVDALLTVAPTPAPANGEAQSPPGIALIGAAAVTLLLLLLAVGRILARRPAS